MLKKILIILFFITSVPIILISCKNNEEKVRQIEIKKSDNEKSDKRWYNLLNTYYKDNFDNKEKLQYLSNDQSWVIIRILKHPLYGLDYKKVIEIFLDNINPNELRTFKTESLKLNYLIYIWKTLSFNSKIKSEPFQFDAFNSDNVTKINKEKLEIDSIARQILDNKDKKRTLLEKSYAPFLLESIRHNSDYTDDYLYKDYDSFKKHPYDFKKFWFHILYNHKVRPFSEIVETNSVDEDRKFINSSIYNAFSELWNYKLSDDENINNVLFNIYNKGEFLSIKNVNSFNHESTKENEINIIFNSNQELNIKQKFGIETKEIILNNEFLIRIINIIEKPKLHTFEEFKNIYQLNNRKWFTNTKPSENKNYKYIINTKKIFTKDHSNLKKIYLVKNDNIFTYSQNSSYPFMLKKFIKYYYEKYDIKENSLVLSLDDFFPKLKNAQEYKELLHEFIREVVRW
ncbi:hypothetical protein MCANUFG1_00593 [Mycoplasmopsis canis UFG1]|uniref:hypothetical protein n=1 Tax=Mycoplasmopsis canis TaxID=29555 RepID=UPI00025B0B4D|nr:hypothetical protein [Mycoplasmopsis canis]EIE42091.1 hypothetical protein MCANUFG1_00593 [Mycoplasmopsis canis UFG1]